LGRRLGVTQTPAWKSLFVLVHAGVAWFLQAGLYRTLMNVAAVLILISGFSLLLYESKEAWGSSAIGFSLGYGSIALILSAFLRPAVRGAGGPLIIAGIVGWLVLTSMYAALLALPELPDSVAVMALLMILATAVWCGTGSDTPLFRGGLNSARRRSLGPFLTSQPLSCQTLRARRM
jgi:peptidoglycan/LPS O-acetylase OafA/YrhL